MTRLTPLNEIHLSLRSHAKHSVAYQNYVTVNKLLQGRQHLCMVGFQIWLLIAVSRIGYLSSLLLKSLYRHNNLKGFQLIGYSDHLTDHFNYSETSPIRHLCNPECLCNLTLLYAPKGLCLCHTTSIIQHPH